jgi:hypothetical protein
MSARIALTTAIPIAVAGVAPMLRLDAQQTPAQTRTVYVSVTDKAGVPVIDLSAADFVVKEGNRVRAVTGVALTTTPIRMAVLVADGGAGGFQQAVAALYQKLQGTAEMSIVRVLENSTPVVDYTTDGDAIFAGILTLGRRPNTWASGHLLEAIVERLRTLPKPGYRPVLVVMRGISRVVRSTLEPDAVRELRRRTDARVYVIAPYGAGTLGGPDGLPGLGLEVVLNDGASESGGRYHEFNGANLVNVAGRIADELLSQHEVSYALPDGVTPSIRLEVTSTRSGVKVHAPTRIAN